MAVLRPSVVALLCGLAGVVVYLNTLDCDLCYDDLPAIIKNQDLRPNVSWTNLLKNDFWGTPMERNNSHKSYRPLCVATFRLNYLLHELEPMGYHLVNILLHGVVCYLYVQLCSLVFSEVWPALIAGLLFAVHPIHTEAVASVVGRAECLSGVFYLLTLLTYNKATKVTGVSIQLLGSVIFCLCASLSKETGLTVLAVCAVYDIAVINNVDAHTVSRLLKRKQLPTQFRSLVIRLGVLCTFGAVFTVARLKINNGLPHFGLHDNPTLYLSSPWRQLNWLHLCFVNLWLTLNPFTLSCDWRVGAVPSINTLVNPLNAATLLTLLSIVGLGWYGIRRKIGHNVILGLSLMVFPYLPASNLFFPVGFVVAERVLYLPSMGLCLLVAHGIHQTMQSLSTKQLKLLLQLSIVCLILLFSAKTYQRNRDWSSNEQLYSAAIRMFPENGLMLNNMGKELMTRGNVTQAVTMFKRAVSATPHIALVHFSLAKALKEIHEYQESEKHFKRAAELVEHEQSGDLAANICCEYGVLLTRDTNLHNHSAVVYALRLWETAISLQPQDIKHLHNVGFAQLKLGRLEEARDTLQSVLSREPDHYGANYKLGEVYLGLGLASRAEQAFRKVLSINGSDVLAKFQVAGLILNDPSPQSEQRLRDAQQLLVEVTTADPNNEHAQFALGLVHHSLHNMAAAERLFLHTLTINSTHSSALYNLGLMYIQAERWPEATHMLTRLLQVNPVHVQGLTQMAACYVHKGDYKTAVKLYKRAIDASNGHPASNTVANYGTVMRELGHWKEAEQLLTSALSLSNANKQFIMTELTKTRALLASQS